VPIVFHKPPLQIKPATAKKTDLIKFYRLLFQDMSDLRRWTRFSNIGNFARYFQSAFPIRCALGQNPPKAVAIPEHSR
jgi:hypothetical protein